jgi:hypothetical protein
MQKSLQIPSQKTLVAQCRFLRWRYMQETLEYEQHAAKCRRMAAEMTTPQLKKQLEDAAGVWDRLANERRRGIIETNPDS